VLESGIGGSPPESSTAHGLPQLAFSHALNASAAPVQLASSMYFDAHDSSSLAL
jgi:hypothetical protein